jgi:hypothetical protein
MSARRQPPDLHCMTGWSRISFALAQPLMASGRVGVRITRACIQQTFRLTACSKLQLRRNGTVAGYSASLRRLTDGVVVKVITSAGLVVDEMRRFWVSAATGGRYRLHRWRMTAPISRPIGFKQKAAPGKGLNGTGNRCCLFL